MESYLLYMEKICKKCEISKSIESFTFDNTRRRSECQSCRAKANKLWREKNKTIILLQNKEKWKMRENDAEYKHKQKLYYNQNKIKLLNQKKEYYKINKEKILSAHKKYERIQLKTNPLFRLRKNIRRRLHLALNGKFKESTTLNLVGCSWNELKIYLESKFAVGMTWDNYGFNGWHIDHITPVSKFDLTNPDELKKCTHYTNLQPLWMIDNLKKGNRI